MVFFGFIVFAVAFCHFKKPIQSNVGTFTKDTKNNWKKEFKRRLGKNPLNIIILTNTKALMKILIMVLAKALKEILNLYPKKPQELVLPWIQVGHQMEKKYYKTVRYQTNKN